MDPERALARTAAAQQGVFTFDDAISCGFSHAAIERRAARGMYRRAEPGVYVITASPTSWRQQVSVATHAVGPVTAASHKTAAFLLGLIGRQPDQVEVVTRRWDRRHREFTVHESTDLVENDIRALDGIAVTTPERTVVDMGASAPRWTVATALDAGLRREMFTLEEVEGFVARVARRGRRGVGVIRPLLEERWAWAGKTESELEDLFRRVLGAASLPQPQPQYEVRDDAGLFVCRADFAYPNRRILVELDSEAFHMDRRAFQLDREKQNQTLALGWRTLRFTWDHLTKHPDEVVRRVSAVLA